MKLSESTIVAITAAITGIAALFALIGLTTPKWILRPGHGLWNCNNVCAPTTAALTILALLFLVIGFVLLIMHLIRLFPQKLRMIPLGLLVIATLFLAATASYLRHFRITGYSFELIVTAHAFAFLASILLAFWYGTTMNGHAVTTTTRSIQSPTIVLPTSRAL